MINTAPMTADGYEVTDQRTCGHTARIFHRLILCGPEEELLLCRDCALDIGLIGKSCWWCGGEDGEHNYEAHAAEGRW